MVTATVKDTFVNESGNIMDSGGPSITRERVEALSSWHDDWGGLKVAVIGLGVTGFSVADTLVELGSRVRVIYGTPDPDRERLLDVIGAERFCSNDHEKQFSEIAAFAPDLLIVSPGCRPDHPATQWALTHDVVLWGDIELAWRLRDKTARVAEWVCVTGTNGKTTTARLTADMLVAGGVKATCAGNIGVPVLDVLRDPLGYDVIVVELSSFQLARLDTVSPYASVCLNIADDHLDWHGSVQEYQNAKARVYENTKCACLYNRADRVTERMVSQANVVEGARAISFGVDSPPPSGVGMVEGILVDRAFHASRHSEAYELVTLQELEECSLAAPHIVQNILAASALARSLNVAPADIASAIVNFTPDPHRTQELGEYGGVRWVDDSKATNAHAADACLLALDRVVWIVGGVLKGVNVGELVRAHVSRLKAVVVIGVERQQVLEAFERYAAHIPRIEIVPDAGCDSRERPAPGEAGRVMRAAVEAAASLASPGDTVVLAPAAASMDQFQDYPDRGRQFQAAVRQLGVDDGTP